MFPRWAKCQLQQFPHPLNLASVHTHGSVVAEHLALGLVVGWRENEAVLVGPHSNRALVLLESKSCPEVAAKSTPRVAC